MNTILMNELTHLQNKTLVRTHLYVFGNFSILTTSSTVTASFFFFPELCEIK